MFESWGHVAYRRRRLILAVTALLFVIMGFWGPQVFGQLKSGGGFAVPGSDSLKAEEVATAALGRDGADVVVLYRKDGVLVDDPSFGAAVTASLAALPKDKVIRATSYFSSRAPQLVSKDRKATYAVLQLAGADDKARGDSYESIESALNPAGLTVKIGGAIPAQKAINGQVFADIGRAESMSMPILLVLLVLIFGSVAAAGLPLIIGVLAILGSFTALHALTYVTDVAIYSINITTVLGLGLAIDYGLFMVVRFREELARAADRGVPETTVVQEALSRTMATAGRTIAVSGLTVAIALMGLVLFPETFLRSMGYGGVATVLVDLVVALTVLPALLAVLGHRVNSWSVHPFLRRLRPRRPTGGESLWSRTARTVMKRPILYAGVIIVVLVFVALPLRNVSWGGIDPRMMPSSAPERQVAESLMNDFTRNSTNPIDVVVTLPQPADSEPGKAALASYTSRLGAVPGVTSVRPAGSAGGTARLALGYDDDALSSAARSLVERVRAVPEPQGATVYVGGNSAELTDELDDLTSVLPWMALVMGAATFILLFLAFGSVLLPIKAIVMNLLSLAATYGVVVWIFQYGNLADLLGFTPTGAIEPSMPILMLAVIFGLSMDYEVFLVSRIREQYDLTGDPTDAIAEGLKRTGSIITSAALLLIVVIGTFSTSGITFIKLVGIGMIFAILIDATVVRAILVPATMRLLGRAAWWAPGPLRRLYARYGMPEKDLPDPEPVTPQLT